MNHEQHQLVIDAEAFAINAHESIGQKRKYTGEPYYVHPVAVCTIVETVTHDPIMRAAALLHDVVEDTPVTIELVRLQFGGEVADLVADLTDVSKPEDGNRAARKAIDRQHSAAACADAQTIKLADLIDNSKSILKHDPDFAKVYIKEKVALLSVLTKGNAQLKAQAEQQVEQYIDALPRRYVYSFWWGDGWVEGTEESISSDTPLSNDDIDRIARERRHFPVTYIHEWDTE